MVPEGIRPSVLVHVVNILADKSFIPEPGQKYNSPEGDEGGEEG